MNIYGVLINSAENGPKLIEGSLDTFKKVLDNLMFRNIPKASSLFSSSPGLIQKKNVNPKIFQTNAHSTANARKVSKRPSKAYSEPS